MCYTIKECVYIFIILAVRVSCYREDNLTKHNIVMSSNVKDCNINTSSEIDPFDPLNRNERNSDEENAQNYDDRVIFPDDDYVSYERTTSTTTPSPQEFEKCVNTCSMNATYDPVCGTDNITYINLERLECTMMCGNDVQVERHAPCPKQPRTTTEYILTSSSIRPYELSKEFLICLQSCPTTSEYNPVCGTNYKTYYNIGKLHCAKSCGVDVQVERHAPCPQQLKTTTESILTSSSIRPYELSNEFLLCLQSCRTTSEYNPVCGTNDKTYYNIGRLQCAQSCGVDVTVLKYSPCSIEILINLNINNNEKKDSKTRTTPRIDNDFAIPQDVLDSIFNNHGDDEAADIDIRNKKIVY